MAVFSARRILFWRARRIVAFGEREQASCSPTPESDVVRM
jgi:hypothetical protein